MTISINKGKVKEKLFLKGLLMKDLAEMLGIGQSYLSNVLNNRVNISPRLAKNMANQLGVEIHEIIEFHEKEEKQNA